MFCPSSIVWGNFAQWVSGVSAILAIFYALFRDNISHYWKRPKLKFIGIIKTRQNSIWIYRLGIKNDSNHIAKNVEFDIEEVKENGTKKENFIPAPHSWTHNNVSSLRAIFPHQTAYLDIITINEKDSPITLYTPAIWSIPDMVKIGKGTTIRVSLPLK